MIFVFIGGGGWEVGIGGGAGEEGVYSVGGLGA